VARVAFERLFYNQNMRSIIAPDPVTRLNTLARQMMLEPDGEPAPPDQPAPCGHTPAELRRVYGDATGADRVSMTVAKRNALGTHDALMPGGKRIRLLKTMLTSACERNCNYCPFRAGRSFRRTTFKPEEMARTFATIHQKGQAEGLFLSSGIIGGGVPTTDKLIDTAEILRNKLGYRGYLHLKIMPGTQHAQVLRAMQLADRISLNLEAPNQTRLTPLAPKKVFADELYQPLKWASEIRRNLPPPRRGRWASFVTQYVVGAVGESDVELLQTTQQLTQAGLQRAYFSAFHPVHDTPLENQTAENPWREHRLYQASFLLRDYGFEFEDLPFSQTGRLPLETDPKLGWARQNLSHTPVDLARADRPSLLKVPGIGPKGADAILSARRERALTDLRQLEKLGVLAKRAAPFILLAGKAPALQMQLDLATQPRPF
jgi:predicted DNA-binding helix-hairpin-helix protein